MSRYDTVKKVIKNRSYRLGTTDLPKVPRKDSDILLISTYGDRCDLIAHQYYGDSALWWFIASVNGLSSNNIPPGKQLRVPKSPEQALLR